jgi:hypothetical protein
VNQTSIGLFTPVTNQCLKAVFDYLHALNEPATVYTLAGKRLTQSIELLSREKPITLKVIDSSTSRRSDIQNAIYDIVQRTAKVVLFIPPGTRVKRRQSADHKQSMASLYANQLGKTVERVYIDDVAVAYGKYNQARQKNAPDTYQLSLPLFDPPRPPPPNLAKIEIAYQPPPRLETPRTWTKKEHPARNPKWVERQLIAAMTHDLVASGCLIIGQSNTFDPPHRWPTVEALHAGQPIKAVFALPEHLPALNNADPDSTGSTRWYTYEKISSEPVAATSGLTDIRFCTLSSEAHHLLDDLGQSLVFAERLIVNGHRYYLPSDYHESYSPARLWELRYMYPLLTRQLDASGSQYRRQMPLGSYFADYVVTGSDYTEIIECKRYPFRHSLRDALNQLLLYKHLYQYLFSVADSHPVKLTLVLPAITISEQVIAIAQTHDVTVRALECDPLQTDMICKKHLAARVEKLVNRTRSH